MAGTGVDASVSFDASQVADDKNTQATAAEQDANVTVANSTSKQTTTGGTNIASSVLSTGGTNSSGSSTGASNVKTIQDINQTTGSSADSIAKTNLLLDSTNKSIANYQSDTAGLVNGILNKAAIAFGPQLAQGNQAGVYNSSSLSLLQGNAMAQAVSDAAASVLSYKTQEEQTAAGLTGQLLNATKTTTGTTTGTQTGATTGTTSENSTINNQSYNQSNQNNSTTVDSIVSAITNFLGTKNQQAVSAAQDRTNTTSEGGKLGSIICTSLVVHGNMDIDLYKRCGVQFRALSQRKKNAYYGWSSPVAIYAAEHPTSFLTKFVAAIFNKRAVFVTDKFSLIGALSTLLVFIPTLLVGLYQLFTERK